MPAGHGQCASRAQLAHTAWQARRRFTGDLTTTWFMVCPPPQLKLHATTPTPQQTQGLAMRKESPNDRVEWRLAGGEGTTAAHLSVGENRWKGGSFGRGLLL
jgi:hypothetical protein